LNENSVFFVVSDKTFKMRRKTKEKKNSSKDVMVFLLLEAILLFLPKKD
jgi:hypothetical protein